MSSAAWVYSTTWLWDMIISPSQCFLSSLTCSAHTDWLYLLHNASLTCSAHTDMVISPPQCFLDLLSSHRYDYITSTMLPWPAQLTQIWLYHLHNASFTCSAHTDMIISPPQCFLHLLSSHRYDYISSTMLPSPAQLTQIWLDLLHNASFTCSAHTEIEHRKQDLKADVNLILHIISSNNSLEKDKVQHQQLPRNKTKWWIISIYWWRCHQN